MYKIIATNYDDKQIIRTFETAVEAREWYNECKFSKQIAFTEIFEIEKWNERRLYEHAQLEEECEKLGCDEHHN